MDIFVCGLIYFILEMFGSKPKEQRNQDLIIPIAPDPEFPEENFSESVDSSDFGYEDYDLFDDFGD